MNEFPRTIEQLKELAPQTSGGSVIEKDGDLWYKIENYDSIPPFFMTITSSSDVWNFIWSTGALSAGRKDSSHAIFPYYTCDKIEDGKTNTGSYTACKVIKDGQTYYWMPFSSNRSFKTKRNLYKNSSGSHIIFEEINSELGLTFCQEWTSSQRYGIVRISSIKNDISEEQKIQILDGCRNIMPACGTVQLQNDSSVLLDAYKKTDLDIQSGLALFSLSSVLSDRAEPSEALWANTCWFSTNDKVYLDPAVEQQFALETGVNQEIEQIKVLKGGRPSCMILKSLDLKPDSSSTWYQVLDTKLELSGISKLKAELKNRDELVRNLEEDIKAGKALLDRYIADADGIQNTNDKITCIHHKANVMFNIMRGGIFASNNTILMDDFVKFVTVRNTSKAQKAAAVCSNTQTTYSELAEAVRQTNDDQLYRLFLEYLPLSFSRRHGDPSRPWNKFNINLKDSLGNPILNYEGNWRDIFQNWEALAMSYPCFTMGMISKFVNAVSCDGFNPYRITRAGLDWEIPEPENPWSNIGYWNDHQIIYLCKLLELQSQLDPAAFNEVLNKKLFSTANIPYHIKNYEELCKNPRDSIEFDYDLNSRIENDVKKYGTDSKLMGKNGTPYLVTLTAKLLQLILTKLANFVPGGGIWMNTQRPEWNDANNALAGYGLSMVTTCYLRRMLTFLKEVYTNCPCENFEIPAQIKTLLSCLGKTYSCTKPQDTMDSESRGNFVKICGTAFAKERLAFYKDNSLLTKTEKVSKTEILTALDAFLVHIEYTIKLNKKDNGLYHSYNTLAINENGMKVENLQEMLEGQVAVLSSRMLCPKEVCELYTALKNSAMYEKRQHSYMLYPDKELPFFEQKNVIDRYQASKIPILKNELDKGYTAPDASCIIYNNAADPDVCHFNPDFRNAGLLESALSSKGTGKEDIQACLCLYEAAFNHKSFTGRSGTFYAYEGLGSIYWHMVSKLLLAVQENFDMAQTGTQEKHDLAAAYYEIRNGLGFNKTPELYGAFPTDPYSHTPSGQGAKQPGMTGQVKEEVITRWGELGLRINNGKLSFYPDLLKASEFDADKTLQFSRFGAAVTYRVTDKKDISISVNKGNPAQELTDVQCKDLFARNGNIKSIDVEIPQDILL